MKECEDQTAARLLLGLERGRPQSAIIPPATVRAFITQTRRKTTGLGR